ncbi:hypothetical protein B879_03808 [Cecembia lonarensis LW9]|uniref:Uncharacterized protein n=1 Tax=Cecembia lonarensis (strain CCUG 58316 / KCTC 22772 / LW9) TaxID=1225176 RepID=K1KTQ9_CECL9|nr:hypothetical protein B879_03808 [Cecembia lonarensis LW9]
MVVAVKRGGGNEEWRVKNEKKVGSRMSEVGEREPLRSLSRSKRTERQEMIPLDHFSDCLSREQSDSGGQAVGQGKRAKWVNH